MRGNVIAIDIGSVNTAIYQLGAGVVLFEPSVVLIDKDQKMKVKTPYRQNRRQKRGVFPDNRRACV